MGQPRNAFHRHTMDEVILDDNSRSVKAFDRLNSKVSYSSKINASNVLEPFLVLICEVFRYCMQNSISHMDRVTASIKPGIS